MTTAETPRWFRPPRPHADVIEDRSVSFLELFYDLVFVVLISQLAHTLAGHVTWTAFRDFIVVGDQSVRTTSNASFNPAVTSSASRA